MAVEIIIPIIELIRADLGEPCRVGRRPYWRCPFHEDHNPSLTVTPDELHWRCFGCGKSGDAIDWVRERRGFSFREAVSFFAGGISIFSSTKLTPRPSKPTPRHSAKPTEDWKHRASCVVEHCAKLLHDPQGAKARLWLHNRGIKSDTIARWQLGYCHKDRIFHGLKVHRGITIPWFDEDHVRAIKIRRPDTKLKYTSVGGSCPHGLFLAEAIRPGLPTLLVEGEFDALLGWQEAGHLVNIVTLGSASTYAGGRALQQLLISPLILLCYDNDDAGRTAVRRWQALSERIRPCHLPQGNDLTEFFLAGGDIGGWIEEQLHQNGPLSTRHLTVEDNTKCDNEITVGYATRQLPDTYPTVPG